MEHLRTRTELIVYARDHCGSRACERAFLTGKVTVLGGFTAIPPGTAPGWILCITSRHGRAWILAVVTDDIQHTYHVRRLDIIPWAQWSGTKYAAPRESIYSGDYPMQAANTCREMKRHEAGP